MKILITGGAGFIGYHVAKAILEKRNEVVIYDDLSTRNIKNVRDLQKEYKNKVHFVKGDVQDFKKLLQASEGVNAIIHLAAIVSVPKSIENPIETNMVTLGGTINVFEVAKKLKIRKVVQASSAAVYSLVSPYAISKYTSELYAKSYFDLYEINSVSLRFFNVYGERQPADSPYSGVVAKFVDVFKKKDKGTLKTEQNINIFGDGKNTRDFIYVKDVAEIISNLIQKEIKGAEVFNLGTGSSRTLLELIKTLEKIFDYKVKVNFKEARVGDIKKSVADISAIKKKHKIKINYDLETGLLDMLSAEN